MGIIFKIGLSQPSTYIEIQLEKKDPQFNKIIFEELKTNMDEINLNFAGALIWNLPENKNFRHIRHIIYESYLNERYEWPRRPVTNQVI